MELKEIHVELSKPLGCEIWASLWWIQVDHKLIITWQTEYACRLDIIFAEKISRTGLQFVESGIWGITASYYFQSQDYRPHLFELQLIIIFLFLWLYLPTFFLCFQIKEFLWRIISWITFTPYRVTHNA